MSQNELAIKMSQNELGIIYGFISGQYNESQLRLLLSKRKVGA